MAPLPLTPSFRWSPNPADSVVPYQDACGHPASYPIAGPLMEILPKKLGRVFNGISTNGATGQGLIEAGLGFKQIDMAIVRQVERKYPVTVTVGLDVSFLADDGSVLFTKKLQSSGYGDVEVTGQSCEVKGLDRVVREAVDLSSEGIARQLAESVRVKEFAEQRKGTQSPAPLSSEPTGGASAEVESSIPNAAPNGSPQPSVAPLPLAVVTDRSSEGTALIFRAIVRDENRDHLVQQEESLTIEIEVKNDGAVTAKDVDVVLTGTPALTSQFPPVLSIGDLLPGEVKRSTSTKRMAIVKEPLHAELVLSLRSTTPIVSEPLAKKFTVVMQPQGVALAEAVPDVDQPPKPVGALKSQKAVVIAIGIGRFRDAQVPPVKFARHDAEVMAGYLRAVGSIPDDRVRVLLDEHALKQDLAEAFDEWLPKRADAHTVAYVYFSGRALVDGVTGAVSLVPFDGTTAAVSRLYSVRRLQESLARASIQRAIFMFDVSLEPTPGAAPSAGTAPNWETGGGVGIEHLMWMVGNHRLQEAHSLEQGRHGLFTYHLLRGLQGLADADRDGMVVAGELCSYARNQVSRVAKEQFGNAQDPLCVPPPGQGAMVRIHPLAKGNNPKPAAVVKKHESPEPSGAQPKAPDVGPGQ